MPPPNRWVIYYDEGPPFTDAAGPPEAAPAVGVQVIGYDDEVTGRTLLSGAEFRFYGGYFWWDGTWHSGDLFGLFDYLARPGLKVVKFGRSLDDARFREIWRQATEDTYLVPKSAYRPQERRA